jgi:CshA-type fibril repeat protein
MDGQGTYTVDRATEVITFTPVSTFDGLARPVRYTVEDQLGQTASTTYTPTVLSPGRLTADPETSIGAMGDPQWVDLIEGDASSTSQIQLDRETVVLSCTVSTNCSVSNNKVTIVGVGTYEMDPANPGFAIFTPTSTFVGEAPSVTYTVNDSIGRSVSSTYTPTVLAVDVVEPDYSRGPANAPQSQNVLENDNVDGARLDPTTLQLRHPITQALLQEPTVTLPGEGTFTFAVDTITFTPNLDQLIAALVANPSRLIEVYQLDEDGNRVLDGNGDPIVIGLEVEITPITYQLLDEDGRTVTATYYPVVFFPNPAAAPDVSYGPADQPQSQNILTNDTATGAELVLSTFKMVDPVTQQPTNSSSVEIVGEGTFRFTGNSIEFTPNLDALIATLAANPSRLIEVYQLDEDGNRVLDNNGDPIVIGLEAEITPITYQIEDEFGRLVTTTYTPKLYFPNPVAAPDYSRGPADQPQFERILTNDASTGTRLLPSTLQLVHPTSRQVLPVGSYSIELADEGTFFFDGQKIIFTPDMDALVEKLRLDLEAHNGDYTNAILTEVWENGVYMGLEAAITPITYQIEDEFGRLVTTTYYPKVFFPKPQAAPDVSRGMINEPQYKEIITNDDPSTGVVFEADYLKIYDASRGVFVTTPVETRHGTYSVQAAEGIVLAAGFGGTRSQIVAAGISASGEFNMLVFTPVRDFVGTADPITYQVRDVFGQKVSSTYTPTIEGFVNEISNAVNKVSRLAMTGLDQFGYLIQIAGSVALIVVGTTSVIKARRRNPSNKI